MRIQRLDSSVIVLHRQNYGLGIGIVFMAGVILLLGLLTAVTGQHFPRISPLMTAVWALVVGSLLAFLGYILTGTYDRFEFSYQGLVAHHSRWRFISWNMRIPAQDMRVVYVELQIEPYYRIWLESDHRPATEIADRLSSANAWHIASMIAEPCQLMVKPR